MPHNMVLGQLKGILQDSKLFEYFDLFECCIELHTETNRYLTLSMVISILPMFHFSFDRPCS